MESLEGSIRSATGIVHTMAVVENKTDCTADPTVNLEGTTVTLRCGYPCPHPNGIGNAVETTEPFSWIGGNCGGVLGNINIRNTEAPDPVNCNIRYTSARTNRQPDITLTTSGC